MAGIRGDRADPEVVRYIGDGTPGHAERARQFVERQMTLWDERGFCLWKLTPKEAGRSPATIKAAQLLLLRRARAPGPC